MAAWFAQSHEGPALARDEASPHQQYELTDAGPRYSFQDVFASGGFGRIRRAFDHRLCRSIAVKELHKSYVGTTSARRFIREAQITARLEHPSIIPVQDVGVLPTGEPFYCMKLVNGRSLDLIVGEQTTLDDRLGLLPHVLAAADAMAYAHEKGIIHRDLKPSNILVGSFGETLVIDWGLAKDLRASEDEDDEDLGEITQEDELSSEDLTYAGAVVGTMPFMAPEQARSEPLDPRADVYALGSMLYYVLSGAPPYEGSTVAEIHAALLAGPPPDLGERVSGVAPDLLAIVRKSMARSRSSRYPSSSALAEDLRRFMTGRLVAARPYSVLHILGRTILKYRSLVSVVGVSVAILTIGTMISLRKMDALGQRVAMQTMLVRSIRGASFYSSAQKRLRERRPLEALPFLFSLHETVGNRLPAQFSTMFASAMLPPDALQKWWSVDGASQVRASSSLPRLVTWEHDDTTLTLWDTEGRRVAELRPPEAEEPSKFIQDVSFFQGGQKLGVLRYGGGVEIYSPNDGGLHNSWERSLGAGARVSPAGDTQSLMTCRFTRLGDGVVCDGPFGVTEFETQTGVTKREIQLPLAEVTPLERQVLMSENGSWAIQDHNDFYLAPASQETEILHYVLPVGSYAASFSERHVFIEHVEAKSDPYEIFTLTGDQVGPRNLCSGAIRLPRVPLAQRQRTVLSSGTSVLMSQDSSFVYIVDGTGNVEVFDPELGTRTSRHPGDSALSIVSDGRVVLTAGSTGVVGVWSNGQRVLSFSAHRGPVLDISPLGGNKFATLGEEEVRIWDLSEIVNSSTSFSAERTKASPDRHLVAQASAKGFRVSPAEKMGEATMETTVSVRDFEWIDNDTVVVHYDREVEVWSVLDGALVQSIRPSLDPDEELSAVLPVSGTALLELHVSSGKNHYVLYWDRISSRLVSSLSEWFLPVGAPEVDPRIGRIVEFDRLGRWPEPGEVAQVGAGAMFAPWHKEIVWYDPERQAIVVADSYAGAEVQTWDAEGNAPLLYLFFKPMFFSDDGEVALVPNATGGPAVVTYPEFESVLSVEGRGTDVVDAKFRSDHRYLIIMWSDGQCAIWDVEQGVERRRFRSPWKGFPETMVYRASASFHEREDLLAIQTLDGVEVLDISTGEMLGMFELADTSRGTELFFDSDSSVLNIVEERDSQQSLVRIRIPREHRSGSVEEARESIANNLPWVLEG